MRFWEAIEEARKGKKIVRNGEIQQVGWSALGLRWLYNNDPVSLCPYNVESEWSVVEDPPKLYSFHEAYAMMKAGKWMRTTTNSMLYKRDHHDNWWFKNGLRERPEMIHSIAIFSPEHVDSQWQEAHP